MPPSGFNQEAINGLLTFVKGAYENARQRRDKQTEREQAFLNTVSNELQGDHSFVHNVDENSIKGLNTFVAECFKDLSAEIDAGQDKHGRAVVEGQAIEKELQQIGSYLQQFTI